jgi:hypothetical protein
MPERRSASRQKTFLQGRLFFDNGRASVDCLIRDISEHGAKLRFSSAVATPDAVELHIPNKRESYQARVKWRNGEEIGVSFKQEEGAALPAPGAAGDWPARIQKLEQDVALLQRKLNEMQSALRQVQGPEF